MSALSVLPDGPPAEDHHWQTLKVLLSMSPDHATDLMKSPPPGRPSSEVAETFSKLPLAEMQRNLLALHLLSGCLLDPEGHPDAVPARFISTIQSQLTLPPPVSFRSCQWIAVPITAVQGNQGKIITMLLGRTPEETSCRYLGPVEIDRETQTRISTAVRTVDRRAGYLYWFLQAREEQPLSGGSLGLPTALASSLLCRGQSWPAGVYASGMIDTDGRLYQVDHIREKIQAAGHQCRLFLTASTTPPSGQSDDNIVPCPTLAEAKLALDMHANRIAPGRIIRLQACLRDRELFFTSFSILPRFVLETEQAGAFLKEAADHPESCIEDLLPSLKKCCRDPLRGGLISRLYPPDRLPAITSKTEKLDFPIFHWLLGCMNYYNHQGELDPCRAWAGLGRQLLDRVEPEEICQFLNIDMVALRFNRYDFRPDLPEKLERLLREEEAGKNSQQSNRFLGAVYGTLCQNYGFCGPSYFSRLVDAADKAKKAFGKKYSHEAKRLLNYRIYALLDGEEPRGISPLLNSYLDCDESSGPGQWFERIFRLLDDPSIDDMFTISLTLRVTADFNSCPEPLKLSRELPRILHHTGHPWQLTTLNLGRILLPHAETRQDAVDCLRQSVEICRGGGPTMQPMAWLALAELHAADLASKEDYEQALKLRDQLLQTDQINREHFRSLLSLNTPASLLEQVRKEKNNLFPFSYR